MIGYLHEAIRLLVLIIPKVSVYIKASKVKDEDKDKNKLLSFRKNDKTLL